MKRTIAFLVASMVVGGSLLGGCGTDTTKTSSGNPAPTPLEFKDLSASMANLFCEVAFSCCTPMEQTTFFKDFPSIPKTAAECEPLVQTQFETYVVAGLKEAVDAGRLKFDGAVAQTCLNQSKEQCAALHHDGPLVGADCGSVFIGLVADGGECAEDNECATAGSICNNPQGAMFGKCQPLPKEGEACLNSDCATGLACADVNMKETCIKPVADGQMCNGSNQCISEYCDFATNTCGQRKAIGAACSDSYECKDGYCDSQTKVCVALKAAGQPCTVYDECESYECEEGTNVCVEFVGPTQCDGM